MIFKKLFELVNTLKNSQDFRNYDVLLMNPQPIPKPDTIMLGLTSFEASATTWDALNKKGILTVIISKQLINNGENYDAVVSSLLNVIHNLFNVIELEDLDFLAFPQQKLIFIYLGIRVEWI
ncbi:MAG: hypothetical protein ABDH59_08625 [Fervidobacterium sp.]